jgi:alpha-D-ribose 1-methylphosphonate 5-triphosphate diphosphatase PhnM
MKTQLMERVTEPIPTIETVVQQRTTHKKRTEEGIYKTCMATLCHTTYTTISSHDKETNMAFKAAIYVHVSGGWLNW